MAVSARFKEQLGLPGRVLYKDQEDEAAVTAALGAAHHTISYLLHRGQLGAGRGSGTGLGHSPLGAARPGIRRA